MSRVLRVLTQPEAEVETKLDQVVKMTGFGVGVCCLCDHNGVDGAKGGGLVLLYRWFLNAVGFKLTGEAHACPV